MYICNFLILALASFSLLESAQNLPTLSTVKLRSMEPQWKTIVTESDVLFVDKKVLENGKVADVLTKRITYYPSGVIYQEQDLSPASTKEKLVFDGASITYYETSAIKRIETYKNGKREGEARTFYPDEGLCLEEEYVNGALDGQVKKYDETYHKF